MKKSVIEHAEKMYARNVAVYGEPSKRNRAFALQIANRKLKWKREEEENKKFGPKKSGPKVRRAESNYYHGMYAPHFTEALALATMGSHDDKARVRPKRTRA